jgi:hypothetical protein
MSGPAGIPSPFCPNTCADHLPAFEESLLQKGNGEQHVGYVVGKRARGHRDTCLTTLRP